MSLAHRSSSRQYVAAKASPEPAEPATSSHPPTVVPAGKNPSQNRKTRTWARTKHQHQHPEPTADTQPARAPGDAVRSVCVQCPICDGSIDASALQPGSPIECFECGNTLSFEREGEGWKLRGVEEPPAPGTWTVTSMPCGGVRAIRPWRSAALIFAVSMAVLTCLLFGAIVVLKGSGLGWPLPLLSVLVSGYALAAVLVNRSVLELGATTLVSTHEPLRIPWLTTVRVNRAEVRTVLLSAQRTLRTNHATAVPNLKSSFAGWSVDLELLDGTRQTLVPSLKTLAERRWVLYVLRRGEKGLIEDATTDPLPVRRANA